MLRKTARHSEGRRESVARILVVDDEEQVRDMLQEMLQSTGHEVLVASNGDAALAMLRESACDLVIADIFMPGKTGLDTIKEVHQEHPDVKIVALSGGGGFDRFDVLEMAPESGATITMKKPIDLEELVMIIRNLTRV
jgi:DNA-binding response OmpR family regulator